VRAPREPHEDRRHDERGVRPQQDEKAEPGPTGNCPPAASVHAGPDEGRERGGDRHRDERVPDEQSLVEDRGRVEGGEAGGEEGRRPGEEARSDIVEQERRAGAEDGLDEQRHEPVAATEPVECGDDVAVDRARLVGGRPAAEPSPLGDRARDVHREPAIHADLRRSAELERNDRAEVEQPEAERDRERGHEYGAQIRPRGTRRSGSPGW